MGRPTVGMQLSCVDRQRGPLLYQQYSLKSQMGAEGISPSSTSPSGGRWVYCPVPEVCPKWRSAEEVWEFFRSVVVKPSLNWPCATFRRDVGRLKTRALGLRDKRLNFEIRKARFTTVCFHEVDNHSSPQFPISPSNLCQFRSHFSLSRFLFAPFLSSVHSNSLSRFTRSFRLCFSCLQCVPRVLNYLSFLSS